MLRLCLLASLRCLLTTRVRCGPHGRALLSSTITLLAAPAYAHEAPVASAVVRNAEDQATLFVTNRGLILRDAADQSLRLLCNEALGLTTFPLPSVALAKQDHIVAGTNHGLLRSEDGGCSWKAAEDLGRSNIPSLLGDPAHPDHLFAASNGAAESALHESVDGGKSWSTLHTMDKGYLVQAMVLSPHDGDTLMATGTHFRPDGIGFFLMRSQDGGDTWDTRELTEIEGVNRVLVQAIHPLNPQVVLLSSLPFSPEQQPSHLWLSEDGGDSFRTTFSTSNISGAKYDRNGRLWVAAGEGLFVYSEELTGFTQVTEAQSLTCIDTDAERVLTCGRYSGDGLTGVGETTAASDVEALSSLSKTFDFADVDAPVACPADSETTKLCKQPWSDWAVEQLGVLITEDSEPAGTAGATAPASASTDDAEGDETDESGNPSPGGCTVRHGKTPAAGGCLMAWGMVAGLCWSRRRRGAKAKR